MARLRIAVLPGDGIGKEVVEAAFLPLEKLGLDAEYLWGDIGWEFWKKEGNALPQRTIDLLCSTDVCLFGAITSKAEDEAIQELNPSLRGEGIKYTSPIIQLRQFFDLYVNLRPCKAFPRNSLNFREGIDLVIFRENTEGLYAGVEFHPLPSEVRRVLDQYNPAMMRFSSASEEEIAVSLRWDNIWGIWGQHLGSNLQNSDKILPFRNSILSLNRLSLSNLRSNFFIASLTAGPLIPKYCPIFLPFSPVNIFTK